MKHFSLRKGLNLPILGVPSSQIDEVVVSNFAILGDDYIGLKPRILVSEGDKVKAGSPILFHKDTPEVQITSPVAGKITAINRGARRKLMSIEIQADKTPDASLDFSDKGNSQDRMGIIEKLCASGLWNSFRTRPYSKVPAPTTSPSAIFITAMDTEPLAADPNQIISAENEAFLAGIEAVAKLSEGKTYLCTSPNSTFLTPEISNLEIAKFTGKHPAGLAGTHIHFLEPCSAAKTVWTINYQDIIFIGRLMLTEKLDMRVTIAMGGPACLNPRLVQTYAGASMSELTQNDTPKDLNIRLISGSVLSGKAGANETAYLHRYARQLTVIEEDNKQIPLGWIRPMFAKYAVQPVLGSLLTKKKFPLTSNLNGGRRAMVPTGTFEELMPQDYLPTQLLRALLVMDTDQAQALGAMELDEEDLGPVGFACPAKYEYGIALRDCLAKIEKEG